MVRQGRSNRRAYSRVSSSADAVADDASEAATSTTSSLQVAPETEALTLESPPSLADENDSVQQTVTTEDEMSQLDDDEEDLITIVVLDPAQSKFNVSANPDWTVAKFKDRGATVHKVPSASQRLIYHGKMLSNDSTLRHFGITKTNTIIHLFPKPNVVVGGGGSDSCAASGDDSDQIHSNSSGGAHVPRIVLDPDEAERRSSILVLASDEVFEAQHRVKLLCLLLLIICSMELLTLFTIMMGVPDSDQDEGPPGDPTDPTHNSGPQETIRPWQNSDYFDLAISGFGFYVALLGIKATTENTLHLAKMYMYGTAVVGVAWNIYYYYMNIQQLKKQEESEDEDIDASDIYAGAFMGMLLPILVWILCCLRAYQFHELLLEAEREAEERTRSEGDEELPDEEAQQEANEELVNHDHELVLQIDDNARIT